MRYVDRAQDWRTALGSIGSDGYARGSLDLPFPAGTTLWLQGLSTAPTRLSDSWRKLTVLP